MTIGRFEEIDPVGVVAAFRRRIGAVLLLCTVAASLCVGAYERKDSWNPLSVRFIVGP